MTKTKDPTASGKDREAMPPPENADGGKELDAEIVRDLELDDRAEQVRGGACPTSRPITKDA